MFKKALQYVIPYIILAAAVLVAGPHSTIDNSTINVLLGVLVWLYVGIYFIVSVSMCVMFIGASYVVDKVNDGTAIVRMGTEVLDIEDTKINKQIMTALAAMRDRMTPSVRIKTFIFIGTWLGGLIYLEWTVAAVTMLISFLMFQLGMLVFRHSVKDDDDVIEVSGEDLEKRIIREPKDELKRNALD